MALLDPITPEVPQVSFRKFDDIDGQRSDIYNGAVQAIKNFKPAQNATHKVEILDPSYDEEEFAPGIASEKEAILKQRSLHRALKGTVRLSDNEGNVLDEQRMTIAHVPHVNSRGLFIRNGSPYVIRNQLRLRPGAYTREKKNGGLETHFNVKPGTGRGFRVEMEPEDGVFKMKIGQSGTRLYPILRELGIPDEAMEQAWGKELFEKNYRAKSGKDDMDLVKVAQKFSKEGLQVKPEEARQIISDALGRAELDEDTTHLTLGERIKNVRPDVLLKATKKQLDVAQGKVEADNRDSQAFQSVHGADDLLKERLGRDITGGLRQILWKASREGNLKSAKPGFLNKNVSSLFEGSGLAQAVEDINSVETLDLRQAITRMGESGISDESAVSREARNVQGSYLGVIDASRAPECYDSKTEVMTYEGWKPWPLVTSTDRLACLIDGGLAFHHPESIYAAPYSGVMYGAKNTHVDYLVTPNHRMYTRTSSKLRNGSKCAWKVTTPEYIQHKNRTVLSSGFAPYHPEVTSGDTFALPEVRAADWDKVQRHGAPPRGRINPSAPPIDMGDWLEFLGWYISEGCLGSLYTTKISQCPIANPENVSAISALLDRLPFAWSFYQDTFTLNGKQLVSYLKQFGKSDTKFLPEYVFEASVENRTRIYNSLMLGDGKRYKGLDRRSYCTGSTQLAKDFARLAFSLGKSSTTAVYQDLRKDTYLPSHEIYVHTRTERLVSGKPQRRATSDYYIVPDYDGMVYCATVPGGLLYVRRNNCIGFWCGNSSRMGLDLRVTDSALKGSDNQLYTTVRNVRTGEMETKSARELSGKVVTFPGEWDSPDKRIPAVKNGEVTNAHKDEVDYEIVHPHNMMARATQLVPFGESVKGGRLLMGSRMSQQALALDEGEAPLVQTGLPDGTSLHKAIGAQSGARMSPVDGVVTKIGHDFIEVADADGKRHKVEMYHNYPMSRKTVLHNEPVVSVGTPVTKGQLVAKSNFTDNDGVLAIGRNLRISYQAARGNTMEDAFQISETAARKLATQNMYKSELSTKDLVTTKKDDYTAIYGSKFKPHQLDKLDDNGVIRVGMQVNPGDPLILGIGKREPGPIGALMDTPKSTTSDKAEIWDHHNPGIVTDVAHTRDGIRVFVKSKTAMTVGSKISGLHGNKGVISVITPDNQMPLDEQGRPIEVIFNTFGIVSRHNPGALAAAVLGKVAEKTGKPYVLQPFRTGENVADFALKEAEKHGISETETITDPSDGRKIPNVFVGNAYVMALQHQAEGKLSARGQASYDANGYPARGGYEGSKRVSLMDTSALVSAGATNFLKDTKLIRGQRNDDYWRQLKMGETPMAPEGSIADEQFKSQLAGAGILIKEHGSQQQLRPLLDKDVDAMAGHEIQNSKTFDFNTLEPIKGGLFDIGMTGGAGGNRFSKISLGVKVPHPLFIDPIIRILGITNNKLEGVMRGTEELNGKTGQEALETALKGVDIDREMDVAKNEIKSGKTSKRDAAVKRLHYLAGLKTLEVAPQDLMVSKVAVVPPKYRPVVSGENVDMIHDLNYLYHDLMEAKQNHQEAKKEFGTAGDEYWTVFKAVQAVSGVDDPVTPKSIESGVKGILKTAIGVSASPKTSLFQRRVVGNSVDMVGRGVITADASLDMDSVGIPINMAWDIFKPFIIRRLVQNGTPASEAVQSVTERSHAAKKALEAEMAERPIVYNRAPALHRYAYTGAWSKLVNDDALHMPYATLKSLGADHDGDSGRFVLALFNRSGKPWVTHQGLTMPLSSSTTLASTSSIHIADVPVIPESKEVLRDGVTQYDVPAGVEIYALDPKTGEHKLYPVTKFSVHENLDMKLVTIGKRYIEQVHVSPDHSLICYREGKILPVKPSDALGLMCPVVKSMSTTTSAVITHAAGVTFSSGVQGNDGTVGAKVNTCDIPLNYETGFFVGALVGDGWISTTNQCLLSNDDQDVLARFLAAGVTHMNMTSSGKQSVWEAPSLGGVVTTRHRIGLQNSWLCAWLAEHVCQGAINKRIPSWSLSAPDEHLLGVLDGLMSTDGCVSVSHGKGRPQLQVNFSSISMDLLITLQFLLRRFGVQSSISKGIVTVAGNQSYTFNMSSVDFVRFFKQHNFSITAKHKQKILEEFADKVSFDSACSATADLVPYPVHIHKLLGTISAEHAAEFYTPNANATSHRKAKEGLSSDKKEGYMSRIKAKRFVVSAKKLGTTDAAFWDWAKLVEDEAITWKQVVKVEDMPKQTGYDLTVPGPLTFATATGLIIQDTENVHIPVTHEAVEDVKNKMMPSKNLFFTGDFETHYEPQQDYVAGLHLAGKMDPTKPVKTYATADDAKQAYLKGEISARTPVRILKK